MVNCNPETVSTDYDTSDRLYFEPLTFERCLNIVDVEKPEGVIVQFGGQTPLNLATPLHQAGVPIIGTSPDSIDLAEDRERFGALLNQLGIPQPENGMAMTSLEARPSRDALVIRCWCGRVTCLVDARWRSFMTKRALTTTCASRSASLPIVRC